MDSENTARIEFDGDLCIERRAEVTAALPDPHTFDRIVIDCTNVTAMDSTMVTVFTRYRRQVQQAGGDPLNIVIVASDSIRRILEIAGLNKLFTVLAAPHQAKRSQDDPSEGSSSPEPVA